MSEKSADRISPELRQIEYEVDNFYKASSLLSLPFASAAWNLLAVNEDLTMMPTLNGNLKSMHDFSAMAENTVWQIKLPLLWLLSSCSRWGKIENKYDQVNFQAAWDFIKLGEEHLSFEAAFTYASKGILDIKLDKTVLYPEYDFHKDSEYEAYNRLLTPLSEAPTINNDKLVAILQPIEKKVQINGERFRYKLDPKLVTNITQLLDPIYAEQFSLPNTWQFGMCQGL